MFRARRKEQYKANPEKEKAASKVYQQAHRERHNELNKKYYKEYPERYEAYRRRDTTIVNSSLYNHAYKGMVVDVTIEEALNIYEDTEKCRYCGRIMEPGKGLKPRAKTLDRINNERILTKDNIQFICHQCNRTKGDRTHVQFLAYMRRALELNDQ
jgi:5-methylcytosine-specific restriction endonuclease McrA